MSQNKRSTSSRVAAGSYKAANIAMFGLFVIVLIAVVVAVIVAISWAKANGCWGADTDLVQCFINISQ